MIRHPGFLVWSLAGHGDQDGCAADILLEIPRVHISKYVQVSRPSLGRRMVPGIVMDPGEYCTWGFCNLTVNSWRRIEPVEASALGGKTSSP